MNSRVVCSDAVSGERSVQSVVYPEDADAEAGRFSVLTAAGMALLGPSVGQTIEWDEPGGTARRLRVEALLYQPEQDLRAKLIFSI
jgi:regulator of nucleoside diphosphate kinase